MTLLHRAALHARPFAPEVLAALIEAIDINDVVDLDAPLPRSVRLDVDPERLIEGFRLSRQLWREGFDAPAVAALAVRFRRGDARPDDAHRFKLIRARFKHLRFAFFLYADAHRSPPLLSLVTLEMGELQDAVRVRPGAVPRRAAALRVLLAAPVRLLLARETNRFRPSDAAGFRRFTLAQIASLRPLLAAPAVGAHAFHAARKVVSRQVSFHDDMRVLFGDEEHRVMARWLATLNGLMGKFHDDLVAQDAAGTFHYRRSLFSLPAAIRTRLEALVVLYLGTSSSEPPST